MAVWRKIIQLEQQQGRQHSDTAIAVETIPSEQWKPHHYSDKALGTEIIPSEQQASEKREGRPDSDTGVKTETIPSVIWENILDSDTAVQTEMLQPEQREGRRRNGKAVGVATLLTLVCLSDVPFFRSCWIQPGLCLLVPVPCDVCGDVFHYLLVPVLHTSYDVLNRCDIEPPTTHLQFLQSFFYSWTSGRSSLIYSSASWLLGLVVNI